MLPLYDYQRDAVAQMIGGQVLNASQIGTGKTLMALGCLEALNAKTSIIIAPKSLVIQWRDESAKFWLGLHVEPVLGNERERKAAYDRFNRAKQPKVLVISYDLFRIDVAKFQPITFDVVVFDEIHRLKEPRTKTKKAAEYLKAHYRFGLSGSPYVNHYGNLYNIMSVLKPAEFDNYYRFIHVNAVVNKWHSVVYFRDEDRLARMFAPYMVRKTFEDAKLSMPALTEQDITFALSEKEWGIYDKAKKVMLLEFETGDISKLSSPITLDNSLVRLGKLQEMADSLELVGEHPQSSKLEALKELIEDQTLPDEKVLVFSRFSRMAEIIHRELGGELLTGKTTNRQEVVDKFKKCGKLLAMTNAGREGINLQEANVVVMFDQDFTAASMEQRVGRAWRLGQKKPVRVYHLLAENTVDYKFKKLVARKRTASDILLKELL